MQILIGWDTVTGLAAALSMIAAVHTFVVKALIRQAVDEALRSIGADFVRAQVFEAVHQALQDRVKALEEAVERLPCAGCGPCPPHIALPDVLRDLKRTA